MATAEGLYAPLRDPSSIRLLTLHPAAKWQPVVASLSEVSLTDEPVYEALSYTWGSSLDERRIIVNGIAVSIRHNLWSFLQRVRLEDGPRVIWVDAICISQTDNGEKSDQVAMIGQIVTGATRVLMWLGEHHSNSEKLFESHSWLEGSESSSQRLSKLLATEQWDWEQPGLWHIWADLPQREYWGRTWVIQEVLLAKAITIYCGDDTSTWEPLIDSRIRELEAMVFVGNFRPHPVSVILGSVSSVLYLNENRPMYDPMLNSGDRDGGEEDTVLNVIDLSSRTVCQDRRDKIYAVLALRPSVAARIRPDYSISLLELFIRLCGDIFKYNLHHDAIDALMDYLYLDNKELQEVVETFLDAESATSRSFTYEDRMHILCTAIDEAFYRMAAGKMTEPNNELMSLDVVKAWATEAQAVLKREGLFRTMDYKFIDDEDLLAGLDQRSLSDRNK